MTKMNVEQFADFMEDLWYHKQTRLLKDFECILMDDFVAYVTDRNEIEIEVENSIEEWMKLHNQFLTRFNMEYNESFEKDYEEFAKEYKDCEGVES